MYDAKVIETLDALPWGSIVTCFSLTIGDYEMQHTLQKREHDGQVSWVDLNPYREVSDPEAYSAEEMCRSLCDFEMELIWTPGNKHPVILWEWVSKSSSSAKKD